MKRKPPKPWSISRRECLKCGHSFKSKGNWNRLCTDCRCENNDARITDIEDIGYSIELIRTPFAIHNSAGYKTPAGRSET